MADDQNQRPYRSNETLARSAPQKAAAAGSDPLAELARLIGQNDPFSEFGRGDAVRREANPQAPPPAYVAPAAAADAQPPEQHFGSSSFGRQNYGSAPLGAGSDLYEVEHQDTHQAVPGYAPAHSTSHGGYADDGYDPNKPNVGHEEEDYYEDERPSGRRMGVLVIAGVFALAVVGTAGAFGYRALFGSSGSSGPPPVIRADATPSKIVATSNKDSAASKQITDRVNDRSGERLVSREETPVEVRDKAAVFPPAQEPLQSSSQPVMGSGIVASEPKRVRTIAILPDQGTEPSPASAQPAPPRVVSTSPARPAAPPRVVNTSPPAADPEPAPAPRQAAPRVAAAAPAASSNAPLSLSPDARPVAPARAPVARTAAVAPAQAAPTSNGNGGGGYAVQVSSQRSEAEAQAAFRSLQGKYPTQLGGKQVAIRRADLGDKGIYFRAVVPLSNGAEATELCTSLKAAGGSCIIQRN